VLNASRHHRKNRASGFLGSGSASPCSTPRGITGKIASLTDFSRVLTDKCSTPRGITGKIARNRWLYGFWFIMCSTPRGITGKIAKKGCSEQPFCLAVLNASRHHRKNRRIIRTHTASSFSAQRLAASPEKSHGDCA